MAEWRSTTPNSAGTDDGGDELVATTFTGYRYHRTTYSVTSTDCGQGVNQRVDRRSLPKTARPCGRCFR